MALFQISWRHSTFISAELARATKAKHCFCYVILQEGLPIFWSDNKEKASTQRQNVSFWISFQEHKSVISELKHKQRW